MPAKNASRGRGRPKGSSPNHEKDRDLVRQITDRLLDKPSLSTRAAIMQTIGPGRDALLRRLQALLPNRSRDVWLGAARQARVALAARTAHSAARASDLRSTHTLEPHPGLSVKDSILAQISKNLDGVAQFHAKFALGLSVEKIALASTQARLIDQPIRQLQENLVSLDPTKSAQTKFIELIDAQTASVNKMHAMYSSVGIKRFPDKLASLLESDRSLLNDPLSEMLGRKLY